MSVRAELDAAWQEWQAASLYQKWARSNPGELAKLEAYRAGGPRPSLATATGRALVAETAAWLEAAVVVPAPPQNRLAPLTLTTPQTIVVTNASRDAAAGLTSGRDYTVVVKPGIDGIVRIVGGRNVNVLCEGDFAIDNTRMNGFWDHTGISVYDGDPDSTVHIENARVLGSTVNDGIVWNCPKRHLHIQTALLKTTPWAQQNISSGLHADGLQSQGGCLSLEVDRATIYTGLQGIFLGDHDGVIGPTHMTRVNVVGGKYQFWKSNPDAAPVVLEDCWLSDGWQPDIGLCVFPNSKGEVVYSQFRTAKARVSADGQFVDFPGTSISGGFRKGRPPGGDFVTRELLGL